QHASGARNTASARPVDSSPKNRPKTRTPNRPTTPMPSVPADASGLDKSHKTPATAASEAAKGNAASPPDGYADSITVKPPQRDVSERTRVREMPGVRRAIHA